MGIPCQTVTGQCLEPPFPEPDGSPVCCPPFSDRYAFRAIDANEPGFRGYRTCYVGIPDATTGFQPPDELFWGLDCGVGCIHCSDVGLVNQIDWLDGRRWLAIIEETLPIRNRDARGILHDLRSNEYHPIVESMFYTRGTCWKNPTVDEGVIRDNGIECFGTDVCSCWGENIFSSSSDGGQCRGNTFAGNPMNGFRTDDFFYMGHRWPIVVSAQVTAQFMNSMYCRKFQDGRFIGPPTENRSRGVQIVVQRLGGIPGKSEHMLVPVFLSTSACNRNLLQHCAGPIATGTDCLTSAEHSFQRFWYAEGPEGDVTRHRFDKLRIIFNTAQLTETGEPVHDSSIAFKNAVLQFVANHNFDGIRFNELDSTSIDPPGANVGEYVKEYDAGESDGPIIEGLLPNSRFMRSKCPIAVTVRVQQVFMRCDLIINRVGQREFPIPFTWGEAHARFQVMIWLSIKATGDSVLRQSWRAEEDPLREQSITIDNNVVVPDIDTISYRNAEDRVVRPGPLVEWRGMLGGNSRPSSVAQRFNFRREDLGGSICNQIANQGYITGTEFLEVPGWPALVDTNPAEPNRLYSGSMLIGALQ